MDRQVFRVAGVQFDVQIADRKSNLKRMLDFMRQAAKESVDVTIFPECALAGYCFDSIDEARLHAESIPGPSTEALAEHCAKVDQHVVVGMLESEGDVLYNAAVLVGPQGVVSVYRKAHLPYLGVDRFTTPGNLPYTVPSVGDLRLGMNICYDASFPEATRSLMLLGADLVALPTNWPPGAENVCDCLIRARALENAIYFIAVNRVGSERGFDFIGQSQIADPAGKCLHRASRDQEEVFFADIDTAQSRRKHLVRVPGQHEINRVADRRPDLYGPLVDESLLRGSSPRSLANVKSDSTTSASGEE